MPNCRPGLEPTKSRSERSDAMIPYGRQNILQADIDAVAEVLRSDFLTQGPIVPRFEQAVAEYCGVQHGVAVNSATSALHIACLALDLGPGDWLWTSPNTFVASANCARYCGANVDFVDIDPHTYNMSVEKLAAKLQQAAKNGRLPKIVIPVHFAGQPCDMPAIYALGQQYDFKIIEDASHAIGASYANIKVGSCTLSDITVFSFHPVKVITTGEGGMALTNNNELANRMRRLRTHGITSDRALVLARPVNEIWNYQQIELGFNYRMTDIQAALGLSQLSRLDDYVARRHDIAKRYDAELAQLPITIPWQSLQTHSSYHLYPIRINEAKAKKSQRQLYDALWQSGIAVNLLYIPVHRQPYYENLGFKAGDFLEAEHFHREVIILPIYPALTDDQHDLVISALQRVFE
jgi:UDP-4-amino-4,6-dideoxy-N-acetyl-beta-L-altrosamine transaminase